MPSEPELMDVDAQNGAGDGSTSDSDDSDYEEVEISMEDMANITKLETELEANPNIYDVHLQVPLGSLPRSLASGHVFTSTFVQMPTCSLQMADSSYFSRLAYAIPFLCSSRSTSPCCANAR